MSYEFYIMSGIAVFVGCTWLYRKGKGIHDGTENQKCV